MPAGFDLGQAIAEADRCLLCHDAPCSKGCPANTQPGEFIRKLRLKNITGAVRTIKRNNVLGGACGVLCPTERLCEKECSAMMKSTAAPEERERPIQIGKIQRFLVEHAWQTGFKVLERGESRSEKIAIVGSGPAGLSCAAELAKAGFNVTVFESRAEAGGMIRYGVVPFRFNLEFLNRELEEIKALGIEFKFNTPIADEKAVEELLNKGYNAVFMATGLWSGTPLKSEKSPGEGLYDSVDYLSSLRDGRIEQTAAAVRGNRVAVIGGGATAMDCVESAVKLGAKDVFLVYRRSYLQMPAEKSERISAMDAGVHFLFLNQPVDYVLDASKKLKGLKLVQTLLGEPDESGRRRPEQVIGSDWVLEVDIVIEAIGNTVVAGAEKAYPNIKVDRKNLVMVDPDTGETSVKGIYAGGDLVRGPSLVVKAVQDGKNAAKAIINTFSQ